MPLKTGLEGKPIFYGFGIGAVFLIGLVIVTLILPVKNLNQQISRLEKELQSLQAEIQKGQAAQARLGALQEEVAKLEKKLQELFIMLPSKKETHIILKRVKSLADEGGFDFTSFVPSTNFNDKEFYYEWPITVTLEGTYHKLAAFFDKLRTLPRIINVADMSIKGVSKKDSDATISTKITLLSYIYKEKEEAPAAPQQKARPPRGGGSGGGLE